MKSTLGKWWIGWFRGSITQRRRSIKIKWTRSSPVCATVSSQRRFLWSLQPFSIKHQTSTSYRIWLRHLLLQLQQLHFTKHSEVSYSELYQQTLQRTRRICSFISTTHGASTQSALWFCVFSAKSTSSHITLSKSSQMNLTPKSWFSLVPWYNWSRALHSSTSECRWWSKTRRASTSWRRCREF